jgi:hypothetical protein
MSWLVPSALAMAGAAALVVAALHLIARSRPVAEPLPTARFVPLRAVHARTRSLALSDVLLLLLRLAAIAAVGAGVAAPVIARARGRVASVVLIDRSRAVASQLELRDSARGVARGADRLIAFDSTARTLGSSSIDSLSPSSAPGSLSAALAAAARAAVELSERSDSVELTIVSPFAAEEIDRATQRLREVWPGRVRLVALRAAVADDSTARIESSESVDDPVIAGLSLAASSTATRVVRVVRGQMTAADSAWARDTGHVLLHWPAADTSATWPRHPTIDAIGGVASATGTLVGRFPRAWSLTGRAVARWADGEPAAVETPIGAGCVRDVAVLVDPASDVTLREPFRRFAAALLEPCGGARSARRIDDSSLARLAGAGPLAAAKDLRATEAGTSPATPWLLVLGALLLLVELAARRAIGERP